MPFERKFPWTNFQELNLNWFLREWETFKTAWETAKSEITSLESSLTQTIDDKIIEIDGALADEVATVEDLADSVRAGLLDIEAGLQTISNKLDKSTSDSSGFYYHTGNGDEILAPSPLSVAFGGTGGSIASQARSNLGAEASENKTNDLATNYASETMYPTCKTTVDYVSSRITSLQTLLNNAIATGDTYTLGQAKSYADTQDGVTLASAKSYSKTYTETYANSMDAQTLASAKAYTDTQDALKVDKTTTVNEKPLSSNVELTAEDIEYTADIQHTADSVGQAISELNTNLCYPLDIYKRITFANGSYKSIGNYSSGLNTGNARIYGQYELSTVVYDVTINPTNASYNYEYALFDENNKKIVSNSTWNTTSYHYRGNVGVKTIRVDVRKSNNANISPTQDTGIVISANSVTNFDQLNAKTSLLEKTINYNIPIKLRVMSQNVGKYNYGSGNGYAGDDVADKLLEWKQMLGSNMPDFVMIQEQVSNFDSGGTYGAKATLFDPLFKDYASDSGSLGIVLFSKYPLENKQKIALTTTAGNRYLVLAETSMGTRTIAIASTHLTPGDDETIRAEEVAQIITALASYDYVILGGDFNTSDATTLAQFTTAGYTLGNNGYFGSMDTITGDAVDNIIVKGFSFYDASVNTEQAITSDHSPVVAEMLMI